MAKMGKGYRFKAKDLRGKKPKELMELLSQIDIALAPFRGQKAIKQPLKTPGMFQNLKKNKAIILTVLTEQRRIQKQGGF